MVRKISLAPVMVMAARDAQFAGLVRIALGKHAKLKLFAPLVLVDTADLNIEVSVDSPMPDTTEPYVDQRLLFTLRGFNSEAGARSAARQWTAAVLWAGLSLRIPIEVLSGVDGDVRDQFGMTISLGEVLAIARNDPYTFTNEAVAFYSRSPVGDELRLSLELFAAAQLERSMRAKLVGLVSALEPLAERERYPADVLAVYTSFVDEIVKSIQNAPTTQRIKDSIAGRARSLREESISGAVERLISTSLTGDTEALKAIQDAYDARSVLLHEGSLDTPIATVIDRAEPAVRRLLSVLVGLDLRVEAPIPPRS